MNDLRIRHVVEDFGLEVLTASSNLEASVQSADIHRPGLEFTGYLGFFPKDRIQLLGRTEVSYLHHLSVEERELRIRDVVAQAPPCFIITRGQVEVPIFTKCCETYEIPLLRTEMKSTPFISRLHNYLERALAKEELVHGVCLNVFGVGVLLRGASGIGKSEVALALVERGHRLVSDDIVKLKQIQPDTLIGTHNGNNREIIHLRGIGFIDVTRLFGSGAFQDETKLDLEIDLVPWTDQTDSDLLSLGSEPNQCDHLGVHLSHIEIPVRPGRDIRSLIEVACKNWRLKRAGYDAFQVFQGRITESN